MKKHLMIAALATGGLAACGEDRAAPTGAPTASPPAQPVQPASQPAPAAQFVAQDEKKEIAPENKGEAPTPRDEEKKDEGAKKAD